MSELEELQQENDLLSERFSDISEECLRLEKQNKALEADNKILREAVEDFYKCGTRHDINPTGQFKECGCFDSFGGDNWQSYIRSQDKSVRDRAREVLEKLKERGE